MRSARSAPLVSKGPSASTVVDSVTTTTAQIHVLLGRRLRIVTETVCRILLQTAAARCGQSRRVLARLRLSTRARPHALRIDVRSSPPRELLARLGLREVGRASGHRLRGRPALAPLECAASVPGVAGRPHGVVAPSSESISSTMRRLVMRAGGRPCCLRLARGGCAAVWLLRRSRRRSSLAAHSRGARLDLHVP